MYRSLDLVLLPQVRCRHYPKSESRNYASSLDSGRAPLGIHTHVQTMRLYTQLHIESVSPLSAVQSSQSLSARIARTRRRRGCLPLGILPTAPSELAAISQLVDLLLSFLPS